MGSRKSREHERLKPKWGLRHEQIITVSKRSAALGQLEAAIWLWFHDGDSIAIHALACNAHDCLGFMCTRVNRQSPYVRWLNELSSADQARYKYVRDYIAHGAKDPDDDVEHSLHHTAALIGFACDCYAYVFHNSTPLMELFLSRAMLEGPITRHSPAARAFKETFGHDMDLISRREFFEKHFPVLEELARDDTFPHIQFP